MFRCRYKDDKVYYVYITNSRWLLRPSSLLDGVYELFITPFFFPLLHTVNATTTVQGLVPPEDRTSAEREVRCCCFIIYDNNTTTVVTTDTRSLSGVIIIMQSYLPVVCIIYYIYVYRVVILKVNSHFHKNYWSFRKYFFFLLYYATGSNTNL